MRKVKLQMQMTVNGYVAGPNSELEWMTWDWDAGLGDFVGNLTDSSDTILMGRKMVDGFCGHWENVANDPHNPEYESGKKFVEMPKIVFSRTIEDLPWKNTTVATRDLENEISKLKNQAGKDIIVYGGAEFVSNLVQDRLIDDYYLFINPVAIKEGLTIFSNLDRLDLNLVESKPFACGIVLLHYRDKRDG